MTTTNSQLKTVVRNWISNQIISTNDDYLASNDYVKFHRIEEEGATSGVYSTILKDTDTSGQIEFVDTLDANESESDGRIKVVGKNMFDDAVDSLETSINTINTNLMNYLKFASTEAATATSGVYHTVITNDNSTGELEFIDTLWYNEMVPVAIALYNGEGEAYLISSMDAPLEGVSQYQNTDYYVYSSELKDYVDYYLNTDPSTEGYQSVINTHAQWGELFNEGNIMSYKLIYGEDTKIYSTVDGKMKIVGQNMFNNLATRVAKLEQRLEALISAFENN